MKPSRFRATRFGADGRMTQCRIDPLDGLDHERSLAHDSRRRLLVGHDCRV